MNPIKINININILQLFGSLSCFVFQLAILEISWIRSRLGQIQVKVLEKSKQVLENSKQVLEKTKVLEKICTCRSWKRPCLGVGVGPGTSPNPG